jgi:hypothetical protein
MTAAAIARRRLPSEDRTAVKRDTMTSESPGRSRGHADHRATITRSILVTGPLSSRGRAHEEGRHGVPQIDCRMCWDAGRFSDQRVRIDPEGLFHRGQHPNCRTCADYLAGPEL